MENVLLFLLDLKNNFNAFEHINWLMLIPLFFVVFWAQYFLHKKKMNSFFHKKKIDFILNKQSFTKIITKHILMQLGILFLVIAFMQPRWGVKEDQVRRGKRYYAAHRCF